MRILVLCYEYPPIGGGGGRVAQSVAEQLAARGKAVRVQTAALGWHSSRDPRVRRRYFSDAERAARPGYLRRARDGNVFADELCTGAPANCAVEAGCDPRALCRSYGPARMGGEPPHGHTVRAHGASGRCAGRRAGPDRCPLPAGWAFREAGLAARGGGHCGELFRAGACRARLRAPGEANSQRRGPAESRSAAGLRAPRAAPLFFWGASMHRRIPNSSCRSSIASAICRGKSS